MLIGDDNRDAADALVLLLSSIGADVRVAYDGPSALEVASRHPPQVALLDIGMPGMDGYELARRPSSAQANRRRNADPAPGLGIAG